MFKHKMLHNLLADMISINTVSSLNPLDDVSNRKLCERLANALEDLAFDCQIFPVPGSNNKWNLLAQRPGTDCQAGGILLSGHCDTVPVDPASWRSDPFTLHESESKLYGVGVTDMKSFFFQIIETLTQLPHHNRRPISVVATADEETTMAGARALKSEQLSQPALNILGEPTALNPIVSHKGYQSFVLNFTGPGGHSSQSDYASNCLDAASRAMQALIQTRQSLEELAHNPRFEVPVSTLNLGRLQAGDAVNRLCAHAELEFDVRPLPGISTLELKAMLEQSLQQALQQFRVDWQLSTTHSPIEPFHSTASPEQRHQCCQFTHSQQTATADYVTEAPFFEALGIPTVILGPGNIQQAHQANEWISRHQLKKGPGIFRRLIEQYCYS